MNSKISIYIAYHKRSHILRSEILTPLQIGSAKKIDGIELRDNSGDNISLKNDFYCELTAQYWAWKNDHDSDYIGLMHYRRVFSFLDDQIEKNICKFGYIEEANFNLDFKKNYGLDDETIQKVVFQNDIILPDLWSVKNVDCLTLYEHYNLSDNLLIKDLDELRKVLLKYNPDYIPYFDSVLDGHEAYFTNMIICRKEIFHKYSEWLFGILGKLEQITDRSLYTKEENRVFGHLSERLLTVWIAKFRAENPQIKIKHLKRIFIEDTKPLNLNLNFKNQSNLACNIAMACDDAFIPHVASIIASILDNSNKNFRYNFILLGDCISEDSKNILTRFINRSNHAEICILDMDNEFGEAAVHMHFSKSTYFRLALDRLLPGLDKVLYLDCDMIVLEDISKLFQLDISNYAIAACHDYIMSAFCEINVKSHSSTGSLDSKKYLMEYLSMGKSWEKYFQAGVLLLNLEKIRRLKLTEQMIKSSYEKPHWFVDQDILNQHMVGSVLIIDQRWNVPNTIESLANHLSLECQNEIDRAISNPAIIHYAGHEAKPWVNPKAKFSEHYWHYLRMTPFYEAVNLNVIFAQLSRNTKSQILSDREFWSALRKNLSLKCSIQRILIRLKRSVSKRTKKFC
jgi:lipopolysaccharide biosynthesis glycosyltransferase